MIFNQNIFFLLLFATWLAASGASVKLVPKVNFKDKDKIASSSGLFNYFCKELYQIHIKYPHLPVPVLKNKKNTSAAEWAEYLRQIKQCRREGKIISEHIIVYKSADRRPKNLYCLMVHLRA
jgi:hypothetical protein